MVKQKPVNVGIQILFCIIPYLWIYAFYRIERLRMGLVMVIVTFVVALPFQFFLPFPYGLTSAFILTVIIPIYFVIHWSKEWNQKLNEYTKE